MVVFSTRFGAGHVDDVWRHLDEGFGDDAPGPARGKGTAAAARAIRNYQEENVAEFVSELESIVARVDEDEDKDESADSSGGGAA